MEVRKDLESTIWYEALFCDLLGLNVRVCFEGGVLPARVVPCSMVRLRPAAPSTAGTAEVDGDGPHSPEDASLLAAAARPPAEGDQVEVRVGASDRSPGGWASGRITAVVSQGAVAVELEGKAVKTLTVLRDAVRRKSSEPPLDPLALERRSVPLDVELLSWVASTDASGCLGHIQFEAGLGLVGTGSRIHGCFGPDKADLPQNYSVDAIVMIGTGTAVRRGEMLLRVHMMHQREVEAFHERRRDKLKMLKEMQEKLETDSQWPAVASFMVEKDLMGRTLGKGAERSKSVEEDFGVEVFVADGDDDESPSVINIAGYHHEDVNSAREALELVRQPFDIDPERVGWVLGKGHREVQEMAQKANLVAASWTGETLELCGTRPNVEVARLLLESHLQYFPIFQEISRQSDAIENSFSALNQAAFDAGLARSPSGAPRRPRSVPPRPADREPSAGRGGRQRPPPPEAELDDAPGPREGGKARGGRASGRGRGKGSGAAGRNGKPANSSGDAADDDAGEALQGAARPSQGDGGLTGSKAEDAGPPQGRGRGRGRYGKGGRGRGPIGAERPQPERVPRRKDPADAADAAA